MIILIERIKIIEHFEPSPSNYFTIISIKWFKRWDLKKSLEYPHSILDSIVIKSTSESLEDVNYVRLLFQCTVWAFQLFI